ncbi:DUF1127 domain-containing protein [Flavimaricola marinus]|uniref:YjiS-like domain-containing protein n=1 Tax=Flavimaricola marinus TaxID=1819565 RepID=A0A238LGL7_9RHOB|nr:DUF1127 domain-containing protein [Flavimaricola marinus]SMY08564.1 hypothetical protein LOM8899_02717 [Flavimaricola marinus]
MTISTNIRQGAGPRQQLSAASIQGPFAMIAHWHGVWVQRRQLGALSGAQLEDLGLTAAEAEQEASRPFWDAPRHWRQ